MALRLWVSFFTPLVRDGFAFLPLKVLFSLLFVALVRKHSRKRLKQGLVLLGFCGLVKC